MRAKEPVIVDLSRVEVDAQLARRDEQPSRTKESVANRLIEGVYAFILVVTVGGWAVLGLIVWLPLLIRTTTMLAGTVFYASLFRDQARVINAQRSVHFSVRFYVRGFDHFIEFYRQRADPEPPIGLFEPLTTLKWRELAVECAWVVGVWLVFYAVLRGLRMAVFG